MAYRLAVITCLLGMAALSGAAMAQTSGGASPGTGSKVETLPGAKPDGSGASTGSSTMPSPSNSAGGSTPGTGSKVEALPPPDTSTSGPPSATSPVPAPSVAPTPRDTGSSGTGSGGTAR